MLLRSIIVEREPIYRQQETVNGFASRHVRRSPPRRWHTSAMIGSAAPSTGYSMPTAPRCITEVVLAVGQRFGLKFDEFHNDGTTISFCGRLPRRLRPQDPRPHRPGHHLWPLKAHRPDLKQLLFVLTMAADGSVPVAFRCSRWQHQ